MKSRSFKSERETLTERARAALASMAWLSRAIGRPDRYLDRFAAGGPPMALAAADREWLALFFGVGDDGMGISASRE